MKTYIVTPHSNCLDETILTKGHNICFCEINMDDYPKIIPVTPFGALTLERETPYFIAG